LRFNAQVDGNTKQSALVWWLQVLTVGRNPKATLVRIVALCAVSFVTFKFVLLLIRIQGISMEPTLHDGQAHCVNRLAYMRHAPERGDIVSVRLAGPSVMYMKRIIALPGESVSFHNGRIFINGQLLAEPYLTEPCDWEHEPIQCGPDQYYVVGDNRTMPFELHTQGRAAREHIVGKLWL